MGLLERINRWFANVKHIPLDQSYAGPKPLPAEVAQRFAYEPSMIEAKLGLDEKTEKNPDFTRYLGNLSFKDGGERNIPVAYYQTKHAQRAPLFFVSPAISERFARFYERVCAIFAKGGVSCLALQNYVNFVDPANGPAELQQFLVRSVTDTQRAVDWAVEEARKPDSRIDPARLGSFGISLGGIKNLTWLAVDHRPRCNIIVMAAGGLVDLLATSKDTDVRAYWEGRKQKCCYTDDQLRGELCEGLSIDPLALAPHVDASRLLYLMSTKDDVVPSELQQKTYEALGKPEAYSMSTGHDLPSAKTVLWYIGQKVSEFVQAKLGMTPA
jgi:dienelactone hydrolase